MIIWAVAAAAALQAIPPGDPLIRLAPLDAAFAAAPAGSQGVAITKVNEGGTAASLGLAEGDIVTAVDGKAVKTAAELQAATAKRRPGEKIEAAIVRNGKPMTLRGKTVPRKRESYAGASTHYGAVPFRGGKLRSILVQPQGKPSAPILYFVQGYTCASIESPDPEGYYGRIVRALVGRGLSVYRVEKSGMGDSAGTPDCASLDFNAELEAFQAGYDAVLKHAGGDWGRVFMLGHSMGGLQAPLIAAKAAKPPRGVAVYGTVLKNWTDWAIGAAAFQPFDYFGADPAEGEAKAVKMRPLIHEFHHGTRSLTQIAAEGPERQAQLRDLGWQGGEKVSGRDISYWRQVAALPLAAAWRDTKSHVLAMFGESDAVAMSLDDHIRIAAIANFYRPGTGTLRTFPVTDHSMLKVGTAHDFRTRNKAGIKLNPPATLNQDVPNAVADWIEKVIKEAPPK